MPTELLFYEKGPPHGGPFQLHRLNDYLVTTTFLTKLSPERVTNLTR